MTTYDWDNGNAVYIRGIVEISKYLLTVDTGGRGHGRLRGLWSWLLWKVREMSHFYQDQLKFELPAAEGVRLQWDLHSLWINMSEKKIVDLKHVSLSYCRDGVNDQRSGSLHHYLGILQSLKACFMLFLHVNGQSQPDTVNIQLAELRQHLHILRLQIEQVFEDYEMSHEYVHPN